MKLWSNGLQSFIDFHFPYVALWASTTSFQNSLWVVSIYTTTLSALASYMLHDNYHTNLLSCTLTKDLNLSNCDGHATFWSTGDLQGMAFIV